MLEKRVMTTIKNINPISQLFNKLIKKINNEDKK